jgi:hypothetical protein
MGKDGNKPRRSSQPITDELVALVEKQYIESATEEEKHAYSQMGSQEKRMMLADWMEAKSAEPNKWMKTLLEHLRGFRKKPR